PGAGAVRVLSGRRLCHEEARVPAARLELGRDPAGEGRQAIEREHAALAREVRAPDRGVGLERRAELAQTAMGGLVDPMGQQQADFLEELPARGNVERSRFGFWECLTELGKRAIDREAAFGGGERG